MGRWRKRLLWTSVVGSAVMALMSMGGRVLPDHAIAIWRSATSETLLVFGTGSTGVVTITDPTGYAIPYVSRWETVIDPASHRQVSGSHVPLVFRRWHVEYTNRQGNPVTMHSWFVVYLLLAALAALVLIGNALAWSYRRSQLALGAWRAHRREQRYPAGEHCPACGYDVRESADRCPECGQAFIRRTVIVAADPN
jgi:hypothetical protein